ncbi:NAD(P)/FAD-dependent oxidoreductase [Pararhodobacter oceanensis]|uniref:FAD-dependent oxidoreductase n=1 Tax=Pararhodobacter oceanensis TaxID=2172121 RepID=A0A2T8HSN8_9RHOB|nr:FAD-binding oxidoreductase [Pararhodobacter oceanensis]PVH28427.1 FAD-dependent oxidoreductase [Pararhodobacter oceanensis]
MTTQGVSATPAHQVYDVVIVGGAIMGSSAAWFLTEAGFQGRILVVEKDPSYAQCSTAHTNSCMRQQFSNALNVQISQFAADFVKNLRARIGDDRVPELTIQNYGYLYLADNEGFAETLRANQKVQLAAGAETRLLSAEDIRAEYPFMQVDDILLGSINTKDEGYWDGGTVFDWWRRSARARGVEYISNEVVAMTRKGARVESVTLASGEVVACGTVVNASGPRAARTAKMAGVELPVEPRKRYTWIFTAETPLPRDLPLTIDPSGVHMRQDGPTTYMVGSRGEPDPAVEPDDFVMDHSLWEEHVWPIVATRIPQFEAIRLVTEWAGHYAYNTLDQNAVLGPHPEVENFIFLNGFSGHGLQQSAAMGRGVAELITHGAYQTLDLTPFSYARIAAGQPMIEQAVI